MSSLLRLTFLTAGLMALSLHAVANAQTQSYGEQFWAPKPVPVPNILTGGTQAESELAAPQAQSDFAWLDAHSELIGKQAQAELARQQGGAEPALRRTQSEPAPRETDFKPAPQQASSELAGEQKKASPQDQAVDELFAKSELLTFRIGLEILSFSRGSASDFPFTADDNGDSLSFSDFDFSNIETVRYFLQYMDDFGNGFELTFYDFDEFDTTLVADGPNVVPTFFGGIPQNPVDSYDSNYQSRLTNVELNYWQRKNPTVRTGIGLRFVNLDEEFDITQSSGGRSLGFFSQTENEMWGVQGLINKQNPVSKLLAIDLGLKAGLLINSSSLDATTASVSGSSDDDSIAGLLNFFAGIKYRMARNIDVRLGYEGLALFGVALAPDQSQAHNIFDGIGNPTKGSLYAGGFYFGATASF